MKTSTAVLLFVIFGVYGMFGVIHYEAPSVKTAAGYNWWLYSGIAAFVIAVIIAIIGFAGQGRSKKPS